MKTMVSKRRFGLWALAVAAMALGVAFPQSAGRVAAQANPPNVTINPALFKELYYRPLTVFSRGGRVTAVTGVPSNPQLYYMGSAGGVFKTEDAGATWV